MAILFFDAFDNNVLDPVKWASTPYTSLVEQNGHLEQNNPGSPEVVYAISGGGIFTSNLIGKEIIWKMSLYNVTSGQAMFSLYNEGLTNPCCLWVGYSSWGWGYEGDGSTDFDVSVDGPIADQVYECKIKFVSTTQIKWYIDDILVKTSDPAVPLTIEPAILVFSSNAYCKFNDFVFQDSNMPPTGLYKWMTLTYSISDLSAGLACQVEKESNWYRLDAADGIFKVYPENPDLTVTEYLPYHYRSSSSDTIWTDGLYSVTFLLSDVPIANQIGEILDDAWVTFKALETDIASDITISTNILNTAVSDVENQVWNAPNRTLTDLGSDIAGDVWSYPERTLSAPTLDTGELVTKTELLSDLSSLQVNLEEAVDSSTDTITGAIASSESIIIGAIGEVESTVEALPEEVWIYETRSLTTRSISGDGSIIASADNVSDAANTVMTTLSGSDSIDMTDLWAHQSQVEITPEAIWSHTSRTLTDYAPSVLWSYNNRTLTDLGSDIAADIWTYTERTLTTNTLSDGSHLALAEGTSGTDSIYNIVKTLSGYDDENAFYLYVYDTGTTDPLIGAKGIIRNTSTGTAIQVATTQENGKLTYTVNEGTYHLYVQLWGYQFNNPYTLSVSDQTASPAIIYGTEFNPSAVYPDCCTIYGCLTDFKLAVHQDVSITISADMLPKYVEDVILTNRSYTVLTDANGNFEFYAVQGSQITVKIEVSGIEQTLTVPVTDSCRLIDLLG